jgi:rubredoxin
MSPQECWLIIDANKPPEKVGTMDKKKFNQLKSVLSNAKPRNTKHKPDAQQQPV